MPELPEVETIRRQLARSLTGARIFSVRVRYPKVIRPLTTARFAAAVRGARFAGFGRRAKVLQLHLSNGKTLLVHLKMTGRLLLERPAAEPRKETEVIFSLAGGRKLFYDDIRRFGWIRLASKEDAERALAQKGYGPEPLDRGFTPEILAACLQRRGKKRIKPLLLDQACVAGVGNIYADESLWDAGILPTRRAGSLRDDEIKALHRAMRAVLTRAIPARGSSADAYLDLYGRKGTFYPRLRAYGKEGKPCAKRDGGIIQKRALGGRGTHWCPAHQR